MAKTRAPDRPVPAWGTVKSLGLADGETVTYFGKDRHHPARRGVKATLTRPEGAVTLRSPRGAPLLVGGAATRFWACPDPTNAGKPIAGTQDDPREGADFSTPEAVRAVRRPGHPGVTWLVMMREANLSQTETARQMGVATVTLNRLVRGKGIPTAKMTVRFARAVGADVRTVWEQVCDYELDLALREWRARGATRK